MSNKGFTLVELLISMLIVGIILTGVVSLLTTTGQGTSNVQNRNEVITDLQAAEQLMGSKIREAWYIFPGASGSLTLNGNAAVTSTTNPVTGTQSWNLGTHPIVAMILPPTVDGICAVGTPASCYTFYAYYPVRRSGVTGSILTPDVLPVDALNDSSVWTLMEYRKAYIATGTPSTTLSLFPSGGTGTVLADFIQASNTGNTYDIFKLFPNAGPVQIVTVNLRSQRTRGSTTTFLPNGTKLITTAMSPRNLNK